MGWQAYHVVFRLQSPVHIGRGKVGNVQRTYPYVTGRILWGALTARLTRDKYQGTETLPSATEYEVVGEQVNGRALTFTYFFPALARAGDISPQWSWEAGSFFRYLFLSAHASTALSYASHSAEEGSLHEVEYLAPYTSEGEPVYLKGYIFARNGGIPGWQRALTRLQIGGERGYGWGRLELTACDRSQAPKGLSLFGDPRYKAHVDGDAISITVLAGAPLLAHTLPHPKLKINGVIEPLVGRMWGWSRRYRQSRGFGQYISDAQICWTPGSLVVEDAIVQIGPYGVWQVPSNM